MRTMSPTLWSGLLWIASCSLPLDVAAQSTVYRCGPDGREYSSTPCPGGRAVAVEDARTLDQQRQAREAALSDAKLADQLAQERRQRERDAKPSKPGSLSAAPPTTGPGASRPASAKKPKRRASSPADPSLSAPVKVPARSKPRDPAAN